MSSRISTGFPGGIEAKKSEPFTELNLYHYLSAFNGSADTGFWKFVEAVVNGVTVVGANSGVAAMKTGADKRGRTMSTQTTSRNPPRPRVRSWNSMKA